MADSLASKAGRTRPPVVGGWPGPVLSSFVTANLESGTNFLRPDIRVGRVVASVGDPSLEMSLPFGRRDLQLVRSGSAAVLRGRRRSRLARRRLHQEGRLSGGCPVVPIAAVRCYDWRSLGPEPRGRKRAVTASPGTRPKRDDHESLTVCREVRVVALGQWTRAPEGTSPIQPLCLPRCGNPAPARLHGGGGVGAHRFQPPRRADVL